jgi:hypothetical protein
MITSLHVVIYIFLVDLTLGHIQVKPSAFLSIQQGGSRRVRRLEMKGSHQLLAQADDVSLAGKKNVRIKLEVNP